MRRGFLAVALLALCAHAVRADDPIASLQQVGEEVRIDGAMVLTRCAPDGIRVRTRGDGPAEELTYRLRSVRAGAGVLFSASRAEPAVPLLHEGRAVRYVRGSCPP